ncbi:hypothetical protein DSCO28_16890 [Desulfosarcina ovata subsp. sediminis]|uniref:Uncharacterized protein n=1 Tax=Desulfosarcina ovata subsp. sediminis TaxID=885957 RepID=A0A5K7ZRC3_9BACT|nr:hypothetical protein DSCO28_16890 [Desulfosarcina ovata subsp. sediminis]
MIESHEIWPRRAQQVVCTGPAMVEKKNVFQKYRRLLYGMAGMMRAQSPHSEEAEGEG